MRPQNGAHRYLARYYVDVSIGKIVDLGDGLIAKFNGTKMEAQLF